MTQAFTLLYGCLNQMKATTSKFKLTPVTHAASDKADLEYGLGVYSAIYPYS